MAAYKVTLLFEQNTGAQGASYLKRVGGWSESLYRSTQATAAQILALAVARADVLSVNSRIVGYRQQTVDPVGGSAQGPLDVPGATQLNDIPQMSVYAIARSSLLNVRRMILRGIPDVAVVTGELVPGAPGITPLVTGYGVFLAGNGWLFRGRDLTLPRVKLSTVQLASGVVTVTTQTPHGWAGGQAVKLGNVALVGGGIGTRIVTTVTTPTPTTATVTGWTLPDGVAGFAYRYVVVYPAITELVVVRVTQRKVGRPFSGFRGRRSKRRS